MALLRKLFYKKPPDGLLEISERVYVFDCCFTTDAWEQENYKGYVGNIIGQLKEHYPDASILIFNFRDGDTTSQLASALSNFDMTIMEYPRHYEGCPLLSMEVIHHFLRSCESWLSLGQQNVLLMHCERGSWPVLAFMLAALLIYRKFYSGESKTLEMVYKQAPRELVHLFSPLNPIPSQLRYLQYVSRRNVATEWPPLDRALTLDCVILRVIPDIDGDGGCRPIFRIYGQDPYLPGDKTAKLLFATPKRNKNVRYFKQAECQLVKIDINCHIQGDVVLECISLYDDMEREKMMYRAMFNTAFIRSNILMLNCDEIDVLWDAKDQIPKDFRAEILFSDMDSAASIVPVDSPFFEEKEGLPIEAFAKVQEMFSCVDWLTPKSDAAYDMLHQMAASDIANEKSETSYNQSVEASNLLNEPTHKMHQEKELIKSLENDPKSSVYLAKDKSLDGSTNSVSSSTSMSEPMHEAQVNESKTSYAPVDPQSIPPLPTPNEKQVSRTKPPTSSSSPTFPSKNLVTRLTQSTLPSQEASKARPPPPPSSSPPEGSLKDITDTTADPSSFPIKEKRDNVLGPTQLPPHPETLPSPGTPTLMNEKGTRVGPPLAPSRPSKYSKEDEVATLVEPTPPSPTGPPASPPLSPPTPPLQEKISMTDEPSPPQQPPPPPPPPPAPAPASAPAPAPAPETAPALAPAPPPPPPAPPRVGQATYNIVASSVPPPPPPPAPNSSSASPISSCVPPPPPPIPSANGNQKGSGVPPPPPLRGANAVGAPSPPPLLARGRGLSQSMISKNQQAKKLKPLHWLKLSRAVQGSLWAETQKSGEAVKTPEIDISELENLFSAANPNADKGAAKSKSKASVANKPEKVQLIDHRRAYNCEIMLSKVKIPLHELMDYVLALDDSAMDVDQVDNLIKFCPTKEEMELLKGYKGEMDKLGKCEQFFMQLMKVPRTESKLRVFSFKLQFGSQVSDLRKSLNSVNSAVEEIRSSSKLKRVMQTILTLGNALNQGTARGAAVGFRLDSLLKLTETRARNNRMTLMHYLCKVLADKLPELLDFSKDLVNLEPAAKVQLKYLAEEMQAISKGLEKVVQELSMAENDGPVSEKFRTALKEFLCSAEGEARSLASLYSAVGKNVDALILYFGEDPARCPYEHVVSTLRNFVRMFIQANDENSKQQEAEKKKAVKEALDEKLNLNHSPIESEQIKNPLKTVK